MLLLPHHRVRIDVRRFSESAHNTHHFSCIILTVLNSDIKRMEKMRTIENLILCYYILIIRLLRLILSAVLPLCRASQLSPPCRGVCAVFLSLFSLFTLALDKTNRSARCEMRCTKDAYIVVNVKPNGTPKK